MGHRPDTRRIERRVRGCRGGADGSPRPPIRQPAALCGIVGLKPTYGRVSRFGLIAFASSLDQIGPLTLTVRDAPLALGVIAGFDPADSTSASEPPVEDYTAALTGDLRNA